MNRLDDEVARCWEVYRDLERDERIAEKTAYLVGRLSHPDDCDCSAECRRLLGLRMESYRLAMLALGLRPLDAEMGELNALARRALAA